MLLRLLLAATVVIGLAGPAFAQDSILVSYSPAQAAALPLFVATEKGWWREAGLDPRLVPFAAGPGQIAAAAARSWDVGVTGAVATVLGTALADLRVVAVANDEAAAHVLVVRAEQAAAPPQSLRGQQALVTLNSSAEFVTLACLRRWNMRREDLRIVNLAPAQIVTAFAVGNGAVAALWSPYQHLLAERTGVQAICNGRDAGVALAAGVLARAQYAREHPSELSRFVAVYLRAIAWQRANPAEAIALMRRSSEDASAGLPEPAVQADLESRTIYTLDEQLRLMSRTGNNPSPLDRTYTALATYLRGVGAIRAVPNLREAITDEVLRRIAADERLRTVATTP